MKFRSLLCLAIAVAAPTPDRAAPTPDRAAPPECAVPSELTQVSVKLPHLAERLHARQPVTIVAIGGASTKGAAAGAPDLAFPHRLQVALAAEYPEVPITVVNQGVARQSTQEMIDRFPTDVFGAHPTLVVWEVGISDAVRGIEIDNFAAALESGISAVRSRSIDIVLVDMQFSRRAATVIDFDRYLHTIHRVGDFDGVYVFPRFEMMRYWSEQHMFNFDEVADKERAQLAAKVYDCIGRELARALRLAVQ
jgi:acyl-CoA thioesterase-1